MAEYTCVKLMSARSWILAWKLCFHDHFEENRVGKLRSIVHLGVL